MKHRPAVNVWLALHTSLLLSSAAFTLNFPITVVRDDVFKGMRYRGIQFLKKDIYIYIYMHFFLDGKLDRMKRWYWKWVTCQQITRCKIGCKCGLDFKECLEE